jgi:hypothetical protein
MPWQIDGTFVRENPDFTGDNVWQQDQEVPIKIIAFRHDYHDEDLAQGIQQCLNITGYNAMQADLNLGDNKIINNALAVNLTDVPQYGQCAQTLRWEFSVANTLSLFNRQGNIISEVVIPTSGGGGGITSIQAIDGLVASPNPITLSGTIGMEQLHGTPTVISGGVGNLEFDEYGRIVSATGGIGSTDLSTNQGDSPPVNVTLYSSSGSGAVIQAATQSVAGVMTAADKAKLDNSVQSQGAWTPAVDGLTMGGDNGGWYTRVGRQVTLYGYVEWVANPTPSPTEYLIVKNLPFDQAPPVAGMPPEVYIGAFFAGAGMEVSGIGAGDTPEAAVQAIHYNTPSTLVVSTYFGTNNPFFAGQVIDFSTDALEATGKFGFTLVYLTDD